MNQLANHPAAVASTSDTAAAAHDELLILEFNSVRNEFFSALGLDPFPASTGIQARICRSDLLVEIEALAILCTDTSK